MRVITSALAAALGCSGPDVTCLAEDSCVDGAALDGAPDAPIELERRVQALSSDLGLGASGEEVQTVQEYLREFGYFPNAVGVANVRDFVGRMSALPAYVARGRSAEGFAELADLLIAARAVAG